MRTRRHKIIALLDRCDQRDVRDNVAAIMAREGWDMFDDELLGEILSGTLDGMSRRKKRVIENRRIYAEHSARKSEAA